MSSTILHAINMIREDKHAVGNLNNWGNEIINLGAIVDSEKIDNFNVVELGFNDKEERICKKLTDQTKKGYLIAAVEDYMEEWGEDLSNFYNVKGERARVVILEQGKRFDASNFKLDDPKKPVKNGSVAFWSIKDEKFVICNGDVVNTEYEKAGNQFLVVDKESGILDGQELVRFEIVK